MKVWLAVDSRGFGGIESHILYLAEALQKKKLDVSIIFIADYGEHPLETKLKQKEIGRAHV